MYSELISVIVPVYNVEKYISQCVDSILAQTYNNLEVILIDDGAIDNSGAICDRYVEKDSRCKVIHKKNAGLGLARNSGLEIATGKYVTFVDSDDWLDKYAIEELYKGICKHSVDFCKCGFKRVTDEGKELKRIHYSFEFFPGNAAKEKLLPRMVGSSPHQHDSIEMCVWGTIYKTSIIQQYKIKFPSERMMISEDLVFNTEYIQYANGGCLIPFVGYQYRFNPHSLSSSYRPDRTEAVVVFYKKMKRKLEGLGYTLETINRLQRLFFVYIRMCIKQEIITIPEITHAEKLGNIKKICENSVLKEVINEYPIRKLGIKQRVFIELLTKKQVRILYFLAKLGII